MRWRIWHGSHTRFEPQPPEKTITANVSMVLRLLGEWFTGEWGIVKHSRMPQQLNALGPFDGFLEAFREWAAVKNGFKLLSSLESNVIRDDGGTYLDGDPVPYDVQIASIHCTSQCGWTTQTPADFVEAYRAVLPALESRKGTGSIGHMMFYATGQNWTESYIQTLQEAHEKDVVVGIFLVNPLRRKTNWSRADLYHPTDGLTVLQPWAIPTLRGLKNLRLALDWDAHEAEDLAGLNEHNMRILWDVAKEESIEHLFMV